MLKTVSCVLCWTVNNTSFVSRLTHLQLSGYYIYHLIQRSLTTFDPETVYIYGFRIVLRINSDHLPKSL